MTAGVQLEISRRLTTAQVDAIAHLVERVTEADGVRPLSEQIILRLVEQDGANLEHFTAWEGPKLVGYGVLDRSNAAVGPVFEVAVDTGTRRSGIGGQLLDLALRETAGHLSLWAHGEFTAGIALSESRGLLRLRTLNKMRRSLFTALPSAPTPADVEISPLDPAELPQIVELNSAAFVDLPDQGSWTIADFEDRMKLDWFDPSGFLVARDLTSGKIIGFHWTKIDSRADTEAGLGGVIGEIYVLAVDPSNTHRGLGRALSMRGLEHLAATRASEVILYVDSENEPAARLYRRLGFIRYDTDILFGSPVPARQAPTETS